MQLLIYCPQITPRVKYIFEFIFKEILLTEISWTDDRKFFTNYLGAKINYSNKNFSDELFFKADDLLFQNNIQIQKIELTEFGANKVPFAVIGGLLPFDMFAASFYFLSRYEEYLPFTPDQHGRYPAEESLQYRLGLLQKPIIDQWSLVLKNLILSRYNDLKFGQRKFSFTPTIDIDRAFHFKSSGLLKNTARFVKAILQYDKERLSNLINTGLNKQKDPFDTYQYLQQIHNKYELSPIFFFLLSLKGDRNYDVNIHPYNELLQSLINKLHKTAQIGIHPSYASNNNWHRLLEEKKLLENIINEKVVCSRQHFLKLHLPKTYLYLQKVNISKDYSMGYASQIGFRASTCTPFFWYDLQLEKQSSLMVYPFAVMDATFRKYLKITPQEAIALIVELINEVKLVNGNFISLWHNESLSEAAEWKGWKIVYEQMIKEACKGT